MYYIIRKFGSQLSTAVLLFHHAWAKKDGREKLMVLLSDGVHASEVACIMWLPVAGRKVLLLSCVRERKLWIAHWKISKHAEPGPCG